MPTNKRRITSIFSVDLSPVSGIVFVRFLEGTLGLSCKQSVFSVSIYHQHTLCVSLKVLSVFSSTLNNGKTHLKIIWD